jgi:hypothetical protein
MKIFKKIISDVNINTSLLTLLELSDSPSIYLGTGKVFWWIAEDGTLPTGTFQYTSGPQSRRISLVSTNSDIYSVLNTTVVDVYNPTINETQHPPGVVVSFYILVEGD